MRRPSPFMIAMYALTVMLISASGCKDESTGPEQIVGSGRLVSQARAASPFTGIQVTGTANVVISQDTIEAVRVEADDNIIDLVTTEVVAGTLSVGLRQGSYQDVTINVYVSMRSIHRLECVGAADFSVTAPISTDAIDCRISGAGHVELSGTATDQTIEISGAGSVRNFALASVHSAVSISGTGSVEVDVADQLDASIAGTGSIMYSGNPVHVHQMITGIGSIGPKP